MSIMLDTSSLIAVAEMIKSLSNLRRIFSATFIWPPAEDKVQIH